MLCLRGSLQVKAIVWGLWQVYESQNIYFRDVLCRFYVGCHTWMFYLHQNTAFTMNSCVWPYHLTRVLVWHNFQFVIMPSVFMFILAYFTSIVKSRSNSFLEPTTNDGKVSCSRKQRDCCSNVSIVADLIIGTSLLLEFCLTQKYHTKRNLKTYIKNVCFHRMIKGVRHFKATE